MFFSYFFILVWKCSQDIHLCHYHQVKVLIDMYLEQPAKIHPKYIVFSSFKYGYYKLAKSKWPLCPPPPSSGMACLNPHKYPVASTIFFAFHKWMCVCIYSILLGWFWKMQLASWLSTLQLLWQYSFPLASVRWAKNQALQF